MWPTSVRGKRVLLSVSTVLRARSGPWRKRPGRQPKRAFSAACPLHRADFSSESGRATALSRPKPDDFLGIAAALGRGWGWRQGPRRERPPAPRELLPPQITSKGQQGGVDLRSR